MPTLLAANHEQAREALRRGRIFLEQREYQRATSLLQRALRLDPTLSDATGPRTFNVGLPAVLCDGDVDVVHATIGAVV